MWISTTHNIQRKSILNLSLTGVEPMKGEANNVPATHLDYLWLL